MKTCYRCRRERREANGYCRACNNLRLREQYRRDINPEPRPYRKEVAR